MHILHAMFCYAHGNAIWLLSDLDIAHLLSLFLALARPLCSLTLPFCGHFWWWYTKLHIIRCAKFQLKQHKSSPCEWYTLDTYKISVYGFDDKIPIVIFLFFVCERLLLVVIQWRFEYNTPQAERKISLPPSLTLVNECELFFFSSSFFSHSVDLWWHQTQKKMYQGCGTFQTLGRISSYFSFSFGSRLLHVCVWVGNEWKIEQRLVSNFFYWSPTANAKIVNIFYVNAKLFFFSTLHFSVLDVDFFFVIVVVVVLNKEIPFRPISTKKKETFSYRYTKRYTKHEFLYYPYLDLIATQVKTKKNFYNNIRIKDLLFQFTYSFAFLSIFLYFL